MTATEKNRFGNELFGKDQKGKLILKIIHQFGKISFKDYGRYVYNWLSLKDKTTKKRIDVFNANYSLFRGLTVTFYLLSIITISFFNWEITLIPFTLGALSNYRMFRFAKLYSIELFITFLNVK